MEFPVFWGTMTAAVSLGQGLGGYAMAAVFDLSQSFEAVLLSGSSLALVATALCLVRPKHLGGPLPERRPG